MNKKNAKVEKILDIAIKILETEGDFGVSMRKVAATAEMSLSNVQYYFKTKDELLKAMADRYFQQCLKELDAGPVINTKEELRLLITDLLSHVYEVSEMCRIFREYWAISTRNESIDIYLVDYYRSMVNLMAGKLRRLAKDEQNLKLSVSILVSFVEGFSVTARSLPLDVEIMSKAFSDILLKQLNPQH